MKIKNSYDLIISLIFLLFLVVSSFLFIDSQFRFGLDKRVCKCENSKNQSISARIVNGTKLANLTQALPWISFLLFEFPDFKTNKTKIVFKCTTSIINRYFAISAAHCVLDLISNVGVLNFYIGFGLTDIDLDEISSSSNLRKGRSYYLPPQLENLDDIKIVNLLINFDIVLIEIEHDNPFEFDEALNILPACLIDLKIDKFEYNFIGMLHIV